jgi:lipid-binding SYLF domain-containing protein
VGGKTTGYYNLIAGSYGLTFGTERIDILIAFMTEDALKGFQKVKGWEVGVDANVALIDPSGEESASIPQRSGTLWSALFLMLQDS